MKKTKIEWCDCTVNPVVGCSFGCPYCYARKINDRFSFVQDFSKPQFFPERLLQLNSKTPKIVFLNSMSDIADWKKEWKETVSEAIKNNPQHSYIFLSKRPEDNPFIEGAWNGCTITKESEMSRFNYLPAFTKRFVSFEPVLEDLQPEKHNLLFKQVHWVVIGAETGNRKNKVIPKKEWIDKIVGFCDGENIPIFMKNSLLPIMTEKNMRRDFPIEITNLKGIIKK